MADVVDDPALEALVASARQGDGIALDELLRRIQGRVYGLALRMLWHPEDARDATQEILVRVITHLGAFRGESAVRTWVYRIACNYLKTARRSRVEAQNQGNASLLNRLTLKDDKVNRSITLPVYIPDVAKVQMWCAWAEVVLGEASFAKPVAMMK